MIQVDFANHAKHVYGQNENIIGLAAGGSWLNGQLDEYSDLDLIVVTREKITDNKHKMLDYARQLDHFISGFTGEHVGEPRVLICLYDNPLLHVDIKFLTLEELSPRVETPAILLDKTGQIGEIFKTSSAKFPYPDHQWIEDRFWTWVHYALLKTGRGEYLEAFDFFGFMRMVVFGPLLLVKNGRLPRGVRKAETELAADDFNNLKSTIPTYDKASLLNSLKNSVALYRSLRTSLFGADVQLQSEAERVVMQYFTTMEEQG